jgi:glycosyltransferase involved in cell wall biosynthesis
VNQERPPEPIAVVIPAYRSARFIQEAIESILAQTRPVAEIVVVDDGSDDDSADVAEQFAPAVQVIRQPRGGAGAARRRGLAASRSPLVAFLDSDDRWLPDAAERLGGALDAQPEAQIAFGQLRNFLDVAPGAPATRRQSLAPQHAVMTPSSSVVRRRAFEIVGHFADGNFSMTDWYTRVITDGVPTVAVEHVVVQRRIHDHNTSAQGSDAADAYLRVIRDVLDRRRSGGPA